MIYYYIIIIIIFIGDIRENNVIYIICRNIQDV